MPRLGPVLFLSLALAGVLPAATLPTHEWMLVLSDQPVIERFPGRIEQTRAVSDSYRQHLRSVQDDLRSRIEAQSIKVTGSIQHLLNAVFVSATPEQAAALKNLPGVTAVVPMRRFHLTDQLTLSNVQQAWSSAAIGGASNAGAGMKIGIIDTGIDQTHPSFQDSSLTPPAGFPKYDNYTLGTTTQSDRAFTNNKVIVARSYVSTVSAGTNAANSRPDDLSARDVGGHGTAVASVVAGVPSTYLGSSLSGVAPKAFLGNYKIYGSPELGGGASEAGILQALEDAVLDGMDVVNFSSSGSAFGDPTNGADSLATAFENAMKNGQVIAVASAGNQGSTGYQAGNGQGTYGSVGTPAYTPSIIAVGGIQNDVSYGDSINVSGPNVPANLNTLSAFPAADGVVLPAPVKGQVVDVTKLGDDPLLCNTPAAGTMTGEIALITRGTCNFSVKMLNAQTAGAVGVIIINNSSDASTLSNWGGLGGVAIPVLMVSQSDGQNLQTFVDANPSTSASLNTQLSQVPATALGIVPNTVANFASRGPSIGNYGLKPDISAAATNFLVAAEDVDPFGLLFSPNRYSLAAGTSFSSPVVAGAAALVKQAQPSLTPLQVKSALVNSSTLSGLLNQAGTAAASIADVGSGLLQAQNAVVSPVEFVPSTVSFGAITSALPAAQTLAVANHSGATLTYTVSPIAAAPNTQVVVTNSGSSISVKLTGSIPPAGRYEGVIDVSGASVPLHIPYMFVVPSNIPYDIVPLIGTIFDGPVGQRIPADEGGILAIRVIDRFGTSVSNVPVKWAVVAGGGQILAGSTDTVTDANGLAGATPVLGPTASQQQFSATVAGMTFNNFKGNARLTPTIFAGGIVDGAAFTANRAIAPGSIISIFGASLSDVTASASQFPLPAGIGGVAFSFDVPSAGVSLPARFHFVSPLQINVQVPWELANYSAATVKVFINDTYSQTYSLNLATYSPGFFVDPSTGQVSALDANLVPVTASHPVLRGNAVALYMNGLGPVHNQPADGWPVSDATSTTVATPAITIGGQPAVVTFSGLAPGYADLYQVNATVPANIGTGAQMVTCSIGGVSCQTAPLYVN